MKTVVPSQAVARWGGTLPFHGTQATGCRVGSPSRPAFTGGTLPGEGMGCTWGTVGCCEGVSGVSDGVSPVGGGGVPGVGSEGTGVSCPGGSGSSRVVPQPTSTAHNPQLNTPLSCRVESSSDVSPVDFELATLPQKLAA
ncbi:hypothetical protein [Cystobacter ferrugineus]|uniref:hypothetical protein n=1 Tax=Cystobacter ferrugineus TaxID=83449 RepID=UPI001FE2C44D|nr:hypothetical protein [Cystobacter ferrugineus]